MADFDKILRWIAFFCHLSVLAQLTYAPEKAIQNALFILLIHLTVDRFYGKLNWKIFNNE